MRQVVTAVLVSRNGADYLERTLAALAAQTRQPDAVIAVDAKSSDRSGELLAASGPAQLVSVQSKASFGDGVAHGMHGVAPAETDNEWLWFLAHDSAPQPRALQQLLAAVEIAPSVAIAGPKLMRWDEPDVIAGFGESMTRFGASMPLVEGELDQAQHDVSDDVLGVAAQGMLVRRSLFRALGGFDPGLPSVDSGLDFSIRARLAGYRVILVPGARVTTSGGPEHFGLRTVSAARQLRVARSAQLHRRLVYARLFPLVVHWLSLLPLAVLRSLGHLLGKRPGAVPGEFAAAFGAAFGGGVTGARRNFRKTRAIGWAAIAPLRLPWSEVRERRGQAREAAVVGSGVAAEPRIGFIGGAGLGVVAFAAIAGFIAFGPLLGTLAVTGGGLLPLGDSVAALWGQVGYGWREIGTGFVGAADPFVAVLAIFGTLTFWEPSLSIVVFYFVALPLAATAAWFAARRMSSRSWVPAVAAVLWAIAPPFLASLTTGHLGASLAHVLLPWFVLAMINGARSVPAAAAASLLFAAVAASSPVLAPALLAGWLVWMIAQPKRVHRLLAIPIPAAVLFAPLVIQQLRLGNPLALLADPGVATPGGMASAWQLALGSPGSGLNGWAQLLEVLSLPAAAAPFVLVVLIATVAALALLAPFVPGSRRAFPSLVIAMLGFALAVASSRIEVTSFGGDTVSIWAGSGLSLFWLGLVGGVIVSLEALGRAAAASGALAVLTTVAMAAPLLAASFMGVADVAPSSGRIVSAVVAAESKSNPRIGTLIIVPEQKADGDDAISVALERGAGTTLDDQSTLAATRQQISETDARLTTLVGNLASRSSFDPSKDFEELYIGYIVLADARTDSAATSSGDVSSKEASSKEASAGEASAEVARTQETDAVRSRILDALDGNDRVIPVGESAIGLLWRVTTQPTVALEPGPGNAATPYGVAVLLAQGLVFLITLLLAIPASRRQHGVRASANSLEGPATTFDEDDHA